MSKGNIYLSGAMEYADDGQLGADWRILSTQKLKELGYTAIDITALDVSYAAQHGNLFQCSTTAGTDDQLQRKANIRQHFVQADLQLIERHSDALIVKYCDGVRRGAGTVSECQHAYNRGIPVFIVNTYQNDAEVPGWLFALSTRMFNTFDELYAYLGSLPDGILRLDQYQNRRSGMYYLCSLCGSVEEKHKAHFVSKVSPLYCKSCVELVKTTNESHKNRYEYFIEVLDQPTTNY